ncbi:MAG: hypothetical protein QGI61_15665 [Alphaproteobacteria bacterium]|jgi:hypothetical protein|nr:hypothetical protein [Alphaproteobacteria bacterium]
MTKASRDKGVRRERMIVSRHKDLHIPCARISAPYKAGPDLLVGAIPDRASLVAEVKGRAKGSGFKTIVDWMGNPPVDLLFLIQDRRDPLVVMGWATYREFLEALRG